MFASYGNDGVSVPIAAFVHQGAPISWIINTVIQDQGIPDQCVNHNTVLSL